MLHPSVLSMCSVFRKFTWIETGSCTTLRAVTKPHEHDMDTVLWLVQSDHVTGDWPLIGWEQWPGHMSIFCPRLDIAELRVWSKHPVNRITDRQKALSVSKYSLALTSFIRFRIENISSYVSWAVCLITHDIHLFRVIMNLPPEPPAWVASSPTFQCPGLVS